MELLNIASLSQSEWMNKMTRLEHLSRISNAVLTPHLNRPMSQKEFKGHCGSAKEHFCGKISEEEKEFRAQWCERQKEIIGEFGAVLGELK